MRWLKVWSAVAWYTRWILFTVVRLVHALAAEGIVPGCSDSCAMRFASGELEEVLLKEKQEGIHPDPAVDAFMRARAGRDKQGSIVTDQVLRVLGLNVRPTLWKGLAHAHA